MYLNHFISNSLHINQVKGNRDYANQGSPAGKFHPFFHLVTFLQEIILQNCRLTLHGYFILQTHIAIMEKKVSPITFGLLSFVYYHSFVGSDWMDHFIRGRMACNQVLILVSFEVDVQEWFSGAMVKAETQVLIASASR